MALISNPISSIADVVKGVLDKVLPDKAANDAAKSRLAEMALSGELQQVSGQLAINQVEASSTNWFVAGARPSIMWICALGLFYQLFFCTVGVWIVNLCGKTMNPPTVDKTLLLTILLPLLGIRTYEKLNQIDTK